MIVCAINSVGACWECFSRHYKVVGDIHNDLIDFLGPGGSGERSQPKKRGQESDVNRFHTSPFVSFGALLGITAALGRCAARASTSNRSNNRPQNVYGRLDANGVCVLAAGG